MLQDFQSCLINGSPYQIPLVQLHTRFPLQLCPMGMQFAAHSHGGSFKKWHKKCSQKLGSCTELQVPIVPKRGQKRWGPPIPGNCKPAHPQRRFQYRELKQRHCTFWCCISKPKLNMSSSSSRLKQMCQNKTFYLSGAFMRFLEA